jgi:hypothetical protein
MAGLVAGGFAAGGGTSRPSAKATSFQLDLGASGFDRSSTFLRIRVGCDGGGLTGFDATGLTSAPNSSAKKFQWLLFPLSLMATRLFGVSWVGQVSKRAVRTSMAG